MKKFFGTFLITLTLLTIGGFLIVPQKVTAQINPGVVIPTNNTSSSNTNSVFANDLERNRANNQNLDVIYSPTTQSIIRTNNPVLFETLETNRPVIQERLNQANADFTSYRLAENKYTQDPSAQNLAARDAAKNKFDQSDFTYRNSPDNGINTIVKEIEKDKDIKAVYDQGQANKGETCTVGNIPKCIDLWIENLFRWLGYALLTVTAAILWVSGQLFDLIFNFSIVNIRNQLNTTTVTETWILLRDFANVFFIFILLFAAINFVLGKSSEGKKMVWGVLFVAIIINFSLFFTKIVIDISNSFTIAIYNQILAEQGAESLSTAVMHSLRIQTLYSLTGGTPILGASEATTVVMLGGSVFMGITAMVFFAIAFMFLVRLVVLFFLMVLSPLAFASSVLPGKDNQFPKWMASLTSQATFPPIFLLLFLVTLKITKGLNIGATQGGLATALVGGNPNDLNIVMNFAIIIIFMIASMIIAKTISTESGGLTSKAFGVGDKVRGWTQKRLGGATLGTAGYVGRSTVGRVGAALADSQSLRDTIAKGGIGGFVAKQKLKAYEKAAGASFDARATGVGKGLGLGDARGKDGYTGYIKNKTKQAEEDAKKLAPSDAVIRRAELEADEAKAKRAQVIEGYKPEIERKEKDVETSMQPEKERIEQEIQRKKQAYEAIDQSDLSNTDRAKEAKENLEAAESERDLFNERLKQAKEVATIDIKKRRDETATFVEAENKTKYVDQLKGVNEEEVKKRQKKFLEEKKKKLEELSEKEKEDYEKIKEVEKIASVRQKQIATNLENTSGFWGALNRSFFIGKRKGVRNAESAAIRKLIKGKSKEKEIADLVKKMSEDDSKPKDGGKEKDGDSKPKDGGKEKDGDSKPKDGGKEKDGE